MKEELKLKTEFDRAFCKKLNLQSRDFLHFFRKRQTFRREMIIKRKTGVTVRPRSLNSGKAIAMPICPIICSL